MVGHEDEERVFEPRHRGGGFEKLAQREVGIGHTGLHQRPALGHLARVFLGQVIRVMGAQREHRREERCFLPVDFFGHKLQERHVPDTPHVGVSLLRMHSLEILAVVEVLDAGQIAERLEPHLVFGGTAVEMRAVALSGKDAGQPVQVGQRLGQQGEGGAEGRYGREHGRQRLNGLHPVGERIREYQPFAHQRVEEGSEAALRVQMRR